MKSKYHPYRSQDEIDFVEWCKCLGIEFQYESEKFVLFEETYNRRFKEVTYLPDFVLPFSTEVNDLSFLLFTTFEVSFSN